MQIRLSSVLVENQDTALQFYSNILGFEKMADISMGEYRWLTVTSPQGIDGVELVLEATAFPPAQVYQKALFEAGIPAKVFFSNDIQAEYTRLKAQGVVFRSAPTLMGPVTSAIFEDGCGNLINLVQPTVPR